MANGMRIECSQLREMPLAMQEQVAMQLLENAGIVDPDIVCQNPERLKLIAEAEVEKYMAVCKPVVTMKALPAVPGHEDLFNISEMAFHNGEAHRSDQVLQILLERKSAAKGEVHEELAKLVEIVRRL